MSIHSVDENVGQTPSQKAILERAASCTYPKVLAKIEERFIPNMQDCGPNFENHWLYGLQNDFFRLVENPNDECGSGQYKGWKPKEIQELYFVLYGETMED